MDIVENVPGITKTEVFPFQPLSNFVVLELKEPQDRVSAGGVIVPSSVQQKTISTRVVAISKDKDVDGNPMIRTVKVGDNVIFDIRSGQLIDVAGQDYLVLRETELYGILTGEGGSVIQVPTSKQKPKLYKVN